MSKANEKLVVIDGNAVIYRSFYAVRSDLSCNGQPTNAVYGFFSVLFKVINELEPQYLMVALDRPEPTFRHKLTADYKAKRIKQPDELYSQIPIIKQILAAMEIPVLELAGYEADDIIGTVVSNVPEDIQCYIVTGDKDSFQLVNDKVSVYWLKQGLQKTVILDEGGVEQALGLEPRQVIDYKALRGDPSDNIPGVPGIGDKTAVELLKSFDSLDKLQTALLEEKIDARIKPRWSKLIKENQASLDLSQQLARIDCAVPLDFSLARAEFGDFNIDTARQAFLTWQLRSLIIRLEKLATKPIKEAGESVFQPKQAPVIIVKDLAEAEKLVQAWTAKEIGLLPIFEANRLVSLALSDGVKIIELIVSEPLQQDLFQVTANRQQLILQPWKNILEDVNIQKVVFQAKEVVKLLLTVDIKLAGLVGDPLLANYLLNPGTRQDKLAEIGQRAGFDFFYQPTDRNEGSCLAGNVGQLIDFHNILAKQLSDNNLLDIYHRVELPLVEVLAKMELNGVKIDQTLLARLATEWQAKLIELAEQIYQQAGEEFNINSPKQLQVILFERLKLSQKGLSRTKSGSSTDAANLQKLNAEHPIIGLLMEYREIAKLLNTYALALPRLVDSRDGRLRANFQQAVTATGRLSASEPNLQNIPTRTTIGKQLRQAFVAEKGRQLLSFDYSQIELRIMASLAKEDNMIADFAAGRDIHLATAAKLNDIALEEVTKQQRRAAKAVNFGILYGQGPHGLAQTTGLSYGAAQDFIDQYFVIYPRINQYMKTAVEEARRLGFAATVWGRRRYLPELDNPNQAISRAAERMAINLPIQGTAADIMKAAMINVDNWLTAHFTGQQAKIILQIHDELLIEAESEQVMEIIAKVPKLMTEVIDLAVPLAVSATVGNNWSEL
jgi:DNA polymerase-1